MGIQISRKTATYILGLAAVAIMMTAILVPAAKAGIVTAYWFQEAYAEGGGGRYPG